MPPRHWPVAGPGIGSAVRALVAIAGAMLLAACAAEPPGGGESSGASGDAGVGVRLAAKDSPAAEAANAGGRRLVGEPYRIAGHTYVPREYKSYSAVGLASWYGRGFRGHHTANGEVYDVANLTAAHPTLPLPSYVRVTNLDNGRSVTVRVNDRGPFRRDRLIDVSAGVAELLGFERIGTARVKVDYMGPARLDGHDRKMLLASYRGPRAGGDAVPPVAAGDAGARVFLVSDSLKPRPRRPIPDANGLDQPLLLTPESSGSDISQAFAPVGGGPARVPPPPIPLRTSLASSYAAAGELSGAEVAAARLAAPRAPRALPPAGARVIQLGVFSDPANASRIASSFRRFGRIEVATLSAEGRTLRSVRVVIEDPRIEIATVMSAATAAGLAGARLTAN